MDNVAGRQVEAASDAGLPGWAPVEFAAGQVEAWARRPVNRAINTATAHQGRVGRIDNCVDLRPSNVTLDHVNFLHRHSPISQNLTKKITAYSFTAQAVIFLLPDVDSVFRRLVHLIARLNIEGRIEISQVLGLNVGPQFLRRVHVN